MTDETKKAPRSYQGVMISGTFDDLKGHRDVLIEALKKEELFPIEMGSYVAVAGDGVISSSLEMVHKASAYIGLIGHRYGQFDESPKLNSNGWSVSRLEFEESQKLDLPTLVFIMGEDHPVKRADVETDPVKIEKLKEYRERAKAGRIYVEFEDLADFTKKAIHGVAGLRRSLEQKAAPPPPAPPPLAPLSFNPIPIPVPTPPAFYAEPPYLGSHAFVGRRAELERLSDWALPTEPHPILLFEAIGGTGKSMLTWEWVTNHAPTVRSDWEGRFWYSFYDKGAQLATFCRYALVYITGEPPEIFDKVETLQLGERLTHHLRERPWLFVLDGLERILAAYHRIDAAQITDEDVGAADEIGKRDPSSAIRPEDDELLRMLATCKPSKILITSRLLPRALVNSSGQVFPDTVLRVPLRGLRPPDAEALFRACGVFGDSAEIQGYLQKNCDCHPLVIGILAGLVNNYMPDRGHFEAWKDAPQGGGRLKLADLPLVQKRTHILSAALVALTEQSHELLSILALLSEAVNYETLSALNSDLSPSALSHTITDLEHRDLIQYNVRERRYDLHPVVRSVTASGLRRHETEKYGWRVIDHFSQQVPGSYEQVETIEDLRAGLQIVRTFLSMGRLEDAYNAYYGEFANALAYKLEAHAEVLGLLKPFFPDGWAKPPGALDPQAKSYLMAWAAFALERFGNFPEALATYGECLRLGLAQEDWWQLSYHLMNISILFYNRNRLERSERYENLAIYATSFVKNPEPLFRARLHLFRTLGERGEWARAEDLRLLLSEHSACRPWEVERQLALSRFWQGTLCEDDLNRAERLTREGKSRNGLRGLHSLRGEWQLEQSAWQLAAESLQEAVRMANEVIQIDVKSETLLALAKLHLGHLSEPRQHAQRLAQAKKPFHRGLAELWLTIGELDRAKWHATAAFEWAWADGEPYVHRYELNKSRALLERLGVEIPNLPPYHPEKDEKLPWEDDVATAIERLRAERAAEGQPEGEG